MHLSLASERGRGGRSFSPQPYERLMTGRARVIGIGAVPPLGRPRRRDQTHFQRLQTECILRGERGLPTLPQLKRYYQVTTEGT